MKFPCAAILIVSLTLLATLGVSAVHQNADSTGSPQGEGHGSCIASATRGVGCPNGTDFLAFINFHLGAFKGLVAPVFAAPSLILIPLLSTILIIAASSYGISLFLLPSPLLASRVLRTNSLSLYRLPFTNWLAFHEHSPSIS